MQRRYQFVNISTDTLRVFESVVDLGGFTKAAERLGLSQPAVSAQIKRLQVLVGGSVFSRTTGGIELNERGKLLIPMVRKLLETNDQILQIGGAAQDPRPVRVGMSSVYGTRFVQENPPEALRKLNVVCDHSPELLRSLSEGFLDVCALYQPSASHLEVVRNWKERLVWVRSRNFTLSPGDPVPLVGWPEMLGDQIAIRLLEAKGLAYRVAFASVEHLCRIEAVRAGLGVMVVPDWTVPDDLVEAREYYLPAVPEIDIGVALAPNVDRDRVKAAINAFGCIANAYRRTGRASEESRRSVA